MTTPGEVFRTQELALEVEPGLEISGTFYAPVAPGRKPAVLLVDMDAPVAERLAAQGAVVLNLQPRGVRSALQQAKIKPPPGRISAPG